MGLGRIFDGVKRWRFCSCRRFGSLMVYFWGIGCFGMGFGVVLVGFWSCFGRVLELFWYGFWSCFGMGFGVVGRFGLEFVF